MGRGEECRSSRERGARKYPRGNPQRQMKKDSTTLADERIHHRGSHDRP